ncbi:MAG: hypothetical protein HC907_38425 [Richelia sp. SM1_7_0]|nr:hypothetical protein [Richelia sp. SM1_7_0]
MALVHQEKYQDAINTYDKALKLMIKMMPRGIYVVRL